VSLARERGFHTRIAKRSAQGWVLCASSLFFIFTFSVIAGNHSSECFPIICLECINTEHICQCPCACGGLLLSCTGQCCSLACTWQWPCHGLPYLQWYLAYGVTCTSCPYYLLLNVRMFPSLHRSLVVLYRRPRLSSLDGAIHCELWVYWEPGRCECIQQVQAMFLLCVLLCVLACYHTYSGESGTWRCCVQVPARHTAAYLWLCVCRVCE
jgi:hypothetical protein